MDLGITEEEAEDILNKEQFLSNASQDYESLKKKSHGSMIELEEMSRNLLNSDLDNDAHANSLSSSNQISDKELDTLLSSGLKSLDGGSAFNVSETIVKSKGPESQKIVGDGHFSGLSELASSRQKKDAPDDSNIRDTIERAISLENSLDKNTTSDLNVHMSEIGEFDTGNFFGGSDAVITSQENLDSKVAETSKTKCIPELNSEEDSDEGFGDFIDRNSKIELVKSTVKDEPKAPDPEGKGKKKA